jgi:hypothetical protein
MANESKTFPEQSQRDPTKPWNQLHPRSQRSSGSELDEAFGEIGTSDIGKGLDAVVKQIDGRKK